MRITDDKISSVKSFFKNEKKQFVKSIDFQKHREFTLLPTGMFIKAIELIPEQRLPQLTAELVKLYDKGFKSIAELMYYKQSWCAYVNAKLKNKQEFYSTNVSTVGDKTEFTWCHNLGGQSKNFSRIYIDAYRNSKFGQDYEIITTNIGNSSFTMEFIKF